MCIHGIYSDIVREWVFVCVSSRVIMYACMHVCMYGLCTCMTLSQQYMICNDFEKSSLCALINMHV
jgi:hypothetical protein